MPINPTNSENEEQFISRCMSIETDGYPTDQAYAICKSKWDNGKMKKLSSPYDRVNEKFNSIRIKQNLLEKFEAQPTIDSTYPGEKAEELITPNPCQSGYIAIGTKIKNGREVPNCVPKE